MSDIKIFYYSPVSIAVFGNTEKYKEKLMELGGKYNPRLKHEGRILKGWIFSRKHESKILEFFYGTDHQEIKIKTFKPIVGLNLILYTYPNDDINKEPEGVDAEVIKVYINEDDTITKMIIKYQGEINATVIICDGKWTLKDADFPNYIDLQALST